MRHSAILLLIVVGLLVISVDGSAQTSLPPTLAPLGGGITGDVLPGNAEPSPPAETLTEYVQIFNGLAPELSSRSIDGVLKVLVLPTALTPNPDFLTASQQNDLIRVAESRTFQVEEGCRLAMPVRFKCQATLVPLYQRKDALNPLMQDYFAQDWSLAFFLGGDPTAAMRVISSTPVEPALDMLYQEGVMIAGIGGSANLFSRSLLAGYQGTPWNIRLSDGVTQIWNDPQQHGLQFGLQGAILEHQFYQLGRIGGLLQVISDQDNPHIGIGVDAYTGVFITSGRTLSGVFGRYTVTILDAETYDSARKAYYRECNGVKPCTPLLSIRNVLVHLLAPGESSYDLEKREHSFGAPPALNQRNYASLSIPAEAGPLILAGDLSEKLVDNPVLTHFGELYGGEEGIALVITAGFPSDSSTERMAGWVADALPGKIARLSLLKNARALPPFPKQFNGIVLVVGDQSKLRPEMLAPIKEAWLAGVPLLADNGGAAALGSFYSSHGPTPSQGEEHELATQASFLDGETQIRVGMGLVDFNIEPQVVEDNRWGRLFSLAYYDPSQLAVGLTRGAALEIDHHGARVIGTNAVILLDLGYAQLGLGENNAFEIANGLLDVFPPGEEVFVQSQIEGAGVDQGPAPSNVTTTDSVIRLEVQSAMTQAPGALPTARLDLLQKLKGNDWPVLFLVALASLVGLFLLWKRNGSER